MDDVALLSTTDVQGDDRETSGMTRRDALMFDNGDCGDDPRWSGTSGTCHSELSTEMISSKSTDEAGASVPAAVM